MNRQYIGARYVTKIYENSQDPSSAEWEENVAFEPLTMVTFQFSTYLSKKPVPASVGNPASNPTYWVVTGQYNGQIAQIQTDIQVINDAIAKIEDVQDFINKYAGKSICIYGDSLSSQALGDDWVIPFTTLMTALGSTVVNHAVAGGNMSDAVSYAVADTNTYDYVLIWCGINDANNGTSLATMSSTGSFVNLFSTLINNIRVNSPNAKIYDFGLSYTNHNSLAFDPIKSLYFYNAALASACILKGVVFKTMLGLPNNSYANNTATSDGLHFTSAYSKDVIYHKIIHDISNDDFVANPKVNLRLDPTDLVFTEASSASAVMFDGYIDPDGIVTISLLFDVTTNLTVDQFAHIDIGAVPDHTQYNYHDNTLFGFNASNNFIVDHHLTTGRYYCEFRYVPKYITPFFLH